MRKGGARIKSNRCVVENLLTVEQSAVSVIGVLAQADVSDDRQIRDGRPDRADPSLHHAVRIPRTAPGRILRLRDAEEQDRTDPEFGKSRRFCCGDIDRHTANAWHGRNGDVKVGSFGEEQGRDEIFGT